MTTGYLDLLKVLGQHLGIDDVLPNSDGVCSLRFDERLTVHLEPDNETELQIYSILAKVPHTVEARERLFSVLLEANLFAKGTGGGVLGLDPDSAEIILSQTLEISEISNGVFLEIIEMHVNVADIWLDRLTRLDDEFLISSLSGGIPEQLLQLKV